VDIGVERVATRLGVLEMGIAKSDPVSLDSVLPMLVREVLPGIDERPILSRAFSELGPACRALLLSAVCTVRRDLDNSALLAPTWEDLQFWLSAASYGDTVGYDLTSRVNLRPLHPSDTLPLYRAAMDQDVGGRWRFRGRTIGLAEFEATLHDGVLAQFAVCEVSTGAIQGLVTSYAADLISGYTYFGFLRIPEVTCVGAAMTGAFLLFRHIFNSFAIRRIYFELPAYNANLIANTEDWGLLHRVATLPSHLFYRGQYVDVSIFSLERREFDSRMGCWVA
jgi:RimJ/RimL family protein N-acetyltransferase